MVRHIRKVRQHNRMVRQHNRLIHNHSLDRHRSCSRHPKVHIRLVQRHNRQHIRLIHNRSLDRCRRIRRPKGRIHLTHIQQIRIHRKGQSHNSCCPSRNCQAFATKGLGRYFEQ